MAVGTFKWKGNTHEKWPFYMTPTPMTEQPCCIPQALWIGQVLPNPMSQAPAQLTSSYKELCDLLRGHGKDAGVEMEATSLSPCFRLQRKGAGLFLHPTRHSTLIHCKGLRRQEGQCLYHQHWLKKALRNGGACL